MLGLQAPQPGAGTGPAIQQTPQQPVMSIGGVLPIMSVTQAEDLRRQQVAQTQNTPYIQGLVGHVRKLWEIALRAKRTTVEQRLLSNLRQRRGEYDPDIMSRIKQQGGSEIYMMLTAVKCRSAAAWLRDTLTGSRSEKPWSIEPTPLPDLSPDQVEQLRQQAIQQITQLIMSTGGMLPQSDMRSMLEQLRDEFISKMQDIANRDADRMEMAMEDQLDEGNFPKAFSEFLDDLCTFPAAFIKGPVLRNKPRLAWKPGPNGTYSPDYQEEVVLEWERVSPFDIYPSPSASSINEGYLFERHLLRQGDLEQLKGVEGYDDASIDQVLDEYGKGGLRNWLWNDVARANAEGKSTIDIVNNSDADIEALQYWGPIQGKLLLEWGLDAADVPDPYKTYHCEVWLIGNYVIKAVLNYHPLGHKPYYKASYEEIPGAFWGNSIPDLCRDTQAVCNAAARAMCNNMAIASGPQVQVNVDRLQPGEDTTQIFPWRIWQTRNDVVGDSQPAINFHQPSSITGDLMQVFEKFSVLADEYTGIPRYMTGNAQAQGAGRTASGMSMLMTNASKSLKQVVGSIDDNVLTPLLENLWVWNMRYSDDPALKGDIQVVARGAITILIKEAAQVRRTEFLQQTMNPTDLQIMGLEGRANVLREVAKTLDMNPNDVVPSADKIRAMEAQQQQQQQMMMQQQQALHSGPTPVNGNGGGSGQTLMDGNPTSDHFSPSPQP